MKNVLAELEQRVCDMVKTDKETGEHPNATPLDYVRWAIEEMEQNQ
jgi:hypothetical protein